MRSYGSPLAQSDWWPGDRAQKQWEDDEKRGGDGHFLAVEERDLRKTSPADTLILDF